MTLFNWLSELPPEAHQRVDSITHSRLFTKSAVLFREGERGHHLYSVQSGLIELSKTLPDGSPVTVRQVQPGELFGEVILFEEERYPVTATVASEAVVSTISRKAFLELMDDPPFRNSFMALLMRKQRYLANHIRLLQNPVVEERIVEYLRNRFGLVNGVQSDVTKRSVAQAIAVRPETFSRALKRLRERGVLDWQGNQITFLKP